MAKKSRSLARKDYGYNTRIVKGRSPRTGFWKSLNKPRELVRPNGIFNPHARIYGVLILIVLMVSGLFLFDQSLKNPNTHGLLGGKSPLDPFTNLWSDALASNDLTGWQQNRASFFNDAVQGVNYIKIIPDANGPGIALSKTPVDISTIAGKELWFQINFRIDNGMTNNEEFGWYLTRNATLPGVGPDANYNPGNDPSVAIYERLAYQSGGPNILLNLLIQKTPNQAINSGDYPGCQGGTGGGVCFALTTQPATIAAGTINFAWDQLNFTGGSPSGTGSQSVIRVGGGGGASYAVKTLPWLQFQGTPYYVGFFVAKGTGNDVRWPGVKLADWPNPDCSLDLLEICNYVPNSATLAPQIDPGGFFGPVIKALISIGVFIVSSLFQFIGFVWTAAIQGFDIIGNFLGIGAIGTAFNSIIASVGGFIISVLTGLIQTFVNMTLATGQILTLFTTGFSNYFTALTGWMAALASLFGTVWTVLGGLLGYAKFSFMTIAVAWWCWGIYEAIFVGFPSWMTWANQTLSITMFFFRGIWWLTQTAWATILNVKSLIHPTAAGGGGTPPP